MSLKDFSFRLHFLLLIFIFIFSFSSHVLAYPQDQLDQCILAAKSNPVVIDFSEESLTSFCDCALKAIVDEGKNTKRSASQCAKSTLNN